MDKEQEEMQFLGLFGIYVETFKIIITWKKIFGQITLALICPIAFIFVAHIEVTAMINSKIWENQDKLDFDQAGTPRYKRLHNFLVFEWVIYGLSKFLYIVSLLVFSLLSTSAVVYTIACLYTAREVTFKKVIRVVPKVWKRLSVTFFCTFLSFVAYNAVAFLILSQWGRYFSDTPHATSTLVPILILYATGFVYMTIMWQLASVVSILEESYGFKAMAKSIKLLKGTMLVATIIFVKLNLSLLGLYLLFYFFVAYGPLSVSARVGLGFLCFLLLTMLFLFGLVIQTVIYFVCKSYHRENIDKSALADHLESYLGEYVPLRTMDVQLEQVHV